MVLTTETAMARETAEAPEAVARLLVQNRPIIEEIVRTLKYRNPPAIVTSARGTSDHAAAFFKYLIEIRLGIPCCSMGASVVSVYGSKLALKNAVLLTISQSGQSPDIVALQDAARQSGALTIALVNAEDSPVAKSAELCVPLRAGPEMSVAATKSFIASCAAGAWIAAGWIGDAAMQRAVAVLPQTLREAANLDWPEAVALAQDADSLYVLGRGPSLPIAQETALKLKETCAIHAEAHSAAEIMHGPLELISAGFPVIAFSPEDDSRTSSSETLQKLRTIGADVQAVEKGGLPFAASGYPLLDPISMIQTAYRFVEATARARGRDPDRPRLLKKVTETV
jgi:glucosamine--fructose-6-phosphate aminotransferase (isomerizing)